MIANDQVDLDELVKTCKRIEKYFVQTSNTERKPVEIYLALLNKTIVYIEGGHSSSDLVFDANEICEESFNPKEDYAAAKDFITRHRKGFDKFIKDNIEEVTHFCSLEGVKYLPTIKNTESQGGHKTLFYIGLFPISDEINHKVELKSNEFVSECSTSIEYVVAQLPKTATWAKFLLNFKVSGWKLYSYITLPIIALVCSYFLLLWNYFALSTASLIYSILIISVFYLFYILLKPIYEAMNNRIAIAPNWLLGLKVNSAQLRAIRTEEKRASGKSIRELQLVIYQATCPICGNEVAIENGKHSYKGRLIGLCDESPREHVFSFDHVTKKGKLLR
ncbi:hypothetical protein [Colwellia sp. BRX10-4]|uniref:hypothetical protein n=1 Tax=Colwellia sp. BRX10-4 TaxID=2759843 RepID=UPI0015F4C1F1|nr:hypothetical protein [Colwellia sp. BRX10-4]MBA6399464.1 hypothetical protein [Colwellia sp. BRX10-4]